MFLGQIFVKNAKKWPQNTFWMAQIEQNMKIWEMSISRECRRSGQFWHSKRQNSAVFQDIDLKLCTRNHQHMLFHMHSWFRKFGNFVAKFFENTIFAEIFPQFSKFSKTPNSEIAVLIARFNFDVLFCMSVGSSLKLYSRRRRLRTVIFDRYRENMTSLWRHSRPTY